MSEREQQPNEPVKPGPEKEPGKPVPEMPLGRAPTIEATRCPFCLQDCARDARVKVCRECLVRHHASCWDENGECAGCGADVALSSEPEEPSFLSSAAFLAGIVSSVLVPSAAIASALVPAARAEDGSGLSEASWTVARGLFLLTITGTTLALSGWLRRDGRRKGLAIGGFSLNFVMLLVLVTAICVMTATWRSTETAPAPPPIAQSPRPQPESPRPEMAKEEAVTWATSSVKALVSTEPAALGPRGWLAFEVAGEPDATWALPRSDALVLGPPRNTWTAAGIVPDYGGRQPLSNVPFLLADRQRLVIPTSDERAILIYSAGSEATPRRVELSAAIGDMVLTGNRVLCTHRERGVLSVIDANAGKLLQEIPIPQGSAAAICRSPRDPRLVVLYAGGEFVGFDAGRLQFLGSAKDPRPAIDKDSWKCCRFTMGGDERFLYGWQTDRGPEGISVFDLARDCRVFFVEHGHSWKPEPDENGRFVFTWEGVHRAGLISRVNEDRYELVGQLKDGNLLAVQRVAWDTGSTSLDILDGRTAEPLRKEKTPITVPRTPFHVSAESLFTLLPGTNRVLRRGVGGVDYKDVEPLGPPIVPKKRLRLAAPHPGSAIVGEAWKLPLRFAQPDVKGLEVQVDGPRGMVYDAGQGAVVWQPSAIQRGVQTATVRISAAGFEDLLVAERLDVDYRTLRLGPDASFGVLPSENLVWWTAAGGEVILMDPATGAQRTIAFDVTTQTLAEGEGKLYVGLRSGRIYELEASTLAVKREHRHKNTSVLSLAPHPDGKRLGCLSIDPKTHALFVSLLPLGSGEIVTHPIPMEDTPGENESVGGDLVWLDGDRFVISSRMPTLVDHWPASRKLHAAIYRWSEKGIEVSEKLGLTPSGALPGRGLIFGKDGLLDETASRLQKHQNALVVSGGRGDYYAAVQATPDAALVSFHALPGMGLLESTKFPFEWNFRALRRAFLLGRSRVVLIETSGGYDTVITFLPYDPSSWKR